MSGLESYKETMPNVEQQVKEPRIESSGPMSSLQYPEELLNQALEEYEQSLLSDEQQLENAQLLTQACQLLKNGQSNESQVYFNKVLGFNPYNKTAIRGLAESYRAQTNLEEAIRCFKALVQVDYSLESVAGLAEVYYENGDYEESLKYYQQSLLLQSEDSPFLFYIFKNLGNIYVHTQNFDAAEESYNKAYALNPKSDVLLVNYGTLELQKGLVESALERFRQAVEVNPENDKAWVGLALIHRNYSDLELSWANVENALAINPDNITAMNLVLEWSFSESQKQPYVIELTERYLEKQPNALYHFLVAKLLLLSCQIYKAHIHIKKSLELEADLEGADQLLEIIESEIKRVESSCP